MRFITSDIVQGHGQRTNSPPYIHLTTRKTTPCSELGDYRAQAEVLKGRLVERGYNAETLQRIIEQVGVIDRSSLLGEKTWKPDRGGIPLVPFITTFSTQHLQIKNIIRKH